MGFWTEQDVLEYTVKNHIVLAPPYGQIAEVGQIDGQLSLDCLNCHYRKTGDGRACCMFCPVCCNLSKYQKFERLKKYNSDLYDYCMEELGEKEVIEWIKKNY